MTQPDFHPFLLPGEHLRWTGRPAQGLRFQPADIFLIPFSLLWGGFAIFWEWSVWQFPSADWFFRLWGVPFILVGLYITFGRFLHDAWFRRNTQYALTERRALILRNGHLTSHDLATLPGLSLKLRSDGSGTIGLGGQWNFMSGRRFDAWTPSARGDSFIGIADARSVYQRIAAATAP